MREDTWFEYYEKDKLCTKVYVDFKKGTVTAENFTDDIISQVFGRVAPTYDRLLKFYESRCVDRHRPDLQGFLEFYGLKEYNPERICRVTHGMCSTDFFWMRFDDEDFGYEDVRKLRGW